jgi:hypothetical protein
MTNWSDKLGGTDLPTTYSGESALPDPNFESETAESVFDADQARALAKDSLDFLAALLLPTVFKYLFPDIFKSIWAWLCESVHKTRDFSQLAIGLPRGFAKTMVIKIFVVYCILFTKKQFILVICGTQTKANNIIADIIGMLNEPNIKKLFGDWKIGVETDRQDLKKFGFRGRNIVLMGAGSGSDIRGITLENARPDVMIFDDIQTREEAESETVSNSIELWLTGTAMKAKSPEGCLFVFIANMYPTKFSILRRLKANPTWMKYIVGGITQNIDGTIQSLWEELHPLSQLIKEFQNDYAMGRPEVFYSEVLNDETASVNHLIDINKIPDDPFANDLQHQGNFIIIDPSNDKANSDHVAIIYFEIFQGKPVARDYIEDRLSPLSCIEKALGFAFKYNCRLIACEANAYQYSLLFWFNYIIAQRGLAAAGINCVDVYSGQRSKNSRILDMFKMLLKGEILLGALVRLAATHQITSFNALKPNNVDGLLDCLTYSPKVIELYGEFIASNLTLQMQEFSNIPVLTVNDNACF